MPFALISALSVGLAVLTDDTDVPKRWSVDEQLADARARLSAHPIGKWPHRVVRSPQLVRELGNRDIAMLVFEGSPDKPMDPTWEVAFESGVEATKEPVFFFFDEDYPLDKQAEGLVEKLGIFISLETATCNDDLIGKEYRELGTQEWKRLLPENADLNGALDFLQRGYSLAHIYAPGSDLGDWHLIEPVPEESNLVNAVYSQRELEMYKKGRTLWSHIPTRTL